MIKLIAAMDEKQGISFEGKLPWNLPKEMARFRKCTTDAPEGKQNAVIMGRKTWESIPAKYRPLSGRLNIVLTKDKTYHRKSIAEGCIVFWSLEETISTLQGNGWLGTLNDIYIIGGASVYQQALDMGAVEEMLLSHIKKIYKCDTIFPKLRDTWKGETVFENNNFTQILYKKIQHD